MGAHQTLPDSIANLRRISNTTDMIGRRLRAVLGSLIFSVALIATPSTAQSEELSSGEVFRRWNSDPARYSLNIPERQYSKVYDHIFWFINQIKKDRVVFVDVGCAIGDYLGHVQRLSRKKIFSVGIDPVDWPGRLSYTKFLQLAIAQTEGDKVAFNLYGSSDLASSSLKRLKQENVTHMPIEAPSKFYHPAPIEGAKGTTSVRTRSLAHVIDDEKIDEVIDLVKVDTQGTDLEVTLSAGKYLDKILFLQIESILSEKPGHLLYDGQSTFSKDRDTLEKRGFKVFNIAAFPAGPEGDVMLINVELLRRLAKRDGIPIF